MVRTFPKAVLSRNPGVSGSKIPAAARHPAAPDDAIPNSPGETLKDAFPTCEGKLDLSRPIEYPREIDL